MNNSNIVKMQKRTWPRSGNSMLCFEPHHCAYCGGPDTFVDSFEKTPYGEWAVNIDCRSCGKRDRPSLPDAAILALARLEG
jgi:hypothetical protein